VGAQIKLPLPPKHFIPAAGVLTARFAATTPPFIRKKRLTGRRLQGVRYEAKVQEKLLELFPAYYIPSPWLIFENGDGHMRYCQPDGFLLDIPNGTITVVEIKYQHTSDAWWQIWHLYMPVLRSIFPTFEFRGIEIVKWYDATTEFPSASLIHDVRRPPHPPQTGVHILKV
jgi:hypothetical protein